jgi:membrane-bound lytic murein transglycosylase B
MTQTKNPTARYAALLALAAALICAIGALAAVGLTVELSRATLPAPAAPSQLHRIDAIPAAQSVEAEAPGASGLGTDYGIVTLALGEGTDHTQAQVSEVLASADRVCEGRTAGVPDEIMAQTVARESGLDQARAHQFVALVTATRCAG